MGEIFLGVDASPFWETRGESKMHIFHTDFEFVISAEPFSKNSDLTLTPLHAPSELDFDLRTFDELQSSGFAEAKEIDFEGAVTAIEVLNKSDAFLLLLDGEAKDDTED